jgi:uncharacterized membrane protein YkvI
MIIILGLLVLTVIMFIAARLLPDHYEWPYPIAVVCAWILAIAIMTLGFNVMDTNGKITEFEATRQTLLFSRTSTSVSDLESATIYNKVIEANRWLAEVQFYARNPWTNWFVPRAVLKLEPIR